MNLLLEMYYEKHLTHYAYYTDAHGRRMAMPCVVADVRCCYEFLLQHWPAVVRPSHREIVSMGSIWYN